MVRRRRPAPAGVLLGAALAAGVAAGAWAGTDKAAGDGKLPRFGSLRAEEVNLRTGPGRRYPVDWVFVRRNLPIEIIAEFDNWRKVRDWQGTEGWVHKSMLSSRRSIIVTGGAQPMRRRAAPDAPPIAHVEERVLGRLLECENQWCRVEIRGIRGWMRRNQFWGAEGMPK